MVADGKQRKGGGARATVGAQGDDASVAVGPRQHEHQLHLGVGNAMGWLIQPGKAREGAGRRLWTATRSSRW